MRIVEMEIFKFEELDKEYQTRAINDAIETLTEFAETEEELDDISEMIAREYIECNNIEFFEDGRPFYY